MSLWGCISAHSMGKLYVCEGTIDSGAYIRILETYVAIKVMYSWDVHAYFSRTIPEHILHGLQQHGLVDTEYVCLTNLSVQIISIENVWR